MKLPIETWAAENDLRSEAIDALGEAAISYRAGAYRAALLFSYVTWGLVLRARILGGRCPPGFPESKWITIRDELTNEDRWDSAVFDATQTQKPTPIFNVTDDLRTQVRYWKDRRNDCAHSKQNTILAAHVESMWEFLRCNLNKFAVGGSVEDLVSRIRDRFDKNLTPSTATCDDLARAIASAVPAARRRDFFKSAAALFASSGFFGGWTADLGRLFEAIVRVSAPEVVTDAVAFLVADPEALVLVLLANPTLVHILDGEPNAARNLWRTKITGRNENSVALYASMLRNGLIPSSEHEEAHRYMIEKVSLPSPCLSDQAILTQTGYFKIFSKLAFEDEEINRFSWGNSNANLAAWYLRNFDIDDQVAATLSAKFHTPPYPDTACASMKAVFSEIPAKHDQFKNSIERLGLVWPTPLLGPRP